MPNGRSLIGNAAAVAASNDTDCCSPGGQGAGAAWIGHAISAGEVWTRMAVKIRRDTDGSGGGGPDNFPNFYSKLQYDVGGGSAWVCDFIWQGSGNTMPGEIKCIDQQPTLHTDVNNPGWGEDEYHWWECHWKLTVTRVYECWVDGNDDFINVQSASASVTSTGILAFGVINAQSAPGGPGYDWFTIMDALQISTTQRIRPASLIWLSASSTCSGTKVYQVPTTISETSITIKVKRGSLSTGTNYLCVQDNDGHMGNGWPVTILS